MHLMNLSPNGMKMEARIKNRVFYGKAEVISFHKRTENRIICSAAD